VERTGSPTKVQRWIARRFQGRDRPSPEAGGLSDAVSQNCIPLPGLFFPPTRGMCKLACRTRERAALHSEGSLFRENCAGKLGL
jgi:hypothetical protein